MKRVVTTGIVLGRIDFQEADRILTVLTPDYGKITAMARGVRKVKSKLAGGIELFSVSHITFIPGKGEIDTLISTRLQSHFGTIVKNLDRTMLGYELLKRINKLTEAAAGPEYFDLLANALEGLNDEQLSNDLLDFWFNMQLLKITGHSPNLRTDTKEQPLSLHGTYEFDYDKMAFQETEQGSFAANHIRLLRLAVNARKPRLLAKIEDSKKLLPQSLELAKAMLGRLVRL
ncbi:DNA repair protein RecO [Candidatus Saccharibacteria bacterium]|nr:DNA repair protein RecO [Candidatus Saccharibacteria bacterium]